jgi:glycosyltransferase involved in cell wall biosynthesis
MALATLTPFAAGEKTDPAVLRRIAELHWALGNVADCIAFQRRVGQVDPSRLKSYLNTLIHDGRGDEALQEVRRVLSEEPEECGLLLVCLTLLRQLTDDKASIAQARERFLTAATTDAKGTLWRARLYRSEQDLDSAMAELNRAVAEGDGDATLLRERASVAVTLGYWGRDACALKDAIAITGGFPELGSEIAHADGLLRAWGCSLDQAASDPERFCHIRSPESVFALISERPAKRMEPSGKGLVMIANSLTAGGAERMVAVTFRHLSERSEFDWLKLYLFNLSREDGADFYLPLTGLSAADVVQLDSSPATHPPFSYLTHWTGRNAQAIYNQLLQDRPAVVHASLEPLTLHAAAAALEAGVPRIVLHTHNMRPTDLHPDSPLPPRWRECYGAVLKRDEVRLVGCAQAAIADYTDWIGLNDTSRLGVVYNGLDFEKFQPASDPDVPRLLRERLGIPKHALVVGTAFKFREEKRPLLWVEAALKVLERYREAYFVMFGDGPLLEATRDFAASNGARDHFSLPGLVPDLNRWLPALDLFMLCSVSEALPNVLLEAQACGVPVIARHVGGIGETMIDGVTGILVDEDGADALASAVLRAIDDPAWRKAAASAGPAFVRERFSIDRMVETLCGYLLG